MDWIVELLGGATGAAIVAGIFSGIQARKARKEKQDDKKNAQGKALRYLMLYIIQERAKQPIQSLACFKIVFASMKFYLLNNLYLRAACPPQP